MSGCVYAGQLPAKESAVLEAVADASAQHAEQTPAEEIATHGVPLNDVLELLADCGSFEQSQQSMYFCAWRDAIVAERHLQKVVDQRASKHPELKEALAVRVAHWKKMRDEHCKKMAHHDWGGGSMEPTANLACAAGETEYLSIQMMKDSSVVPCKNKMVNKNKAVVCRQPL